VDDEADTGELPTVSEELRELVQIRFELERIRYRLGILVFWFVVLPIVGTFIVLAVLEG
jgi:hypothetical protein